MIDAATEALLLLLDPARLTYLVIGVGLGLTLGFIPGLGGLVGLAILLPFVYGMDLHAGVAMLVGLVAVTSTSDTFPAVLLGVPGTSSSQATIMDGYPLAKQGQARTALSAAFFASMGGGVIGSIIFLGWIQVANPLIQALGSPELLMLTLLGLSMVALLSGGTRFAGLLTACAGLLLGAVGLSPATPTYRYTLDTLYLSDGVPLIILALGLFGIPEVIDLLAQNRSVAGNNPQGGSIRQGLRAVWRHKWMVPINAGIGNVVGVVPGLGGSVVDWIAWGVGRRTLKGATESFGKGDIRGVIAVESANNAKDTGGLVPTLLVGIPGSGSMAVFLAGLTLLGITPGPSLVNQELPLILSIAWTLALANILATTVCAVLSMPISRLTAVPPGRLMPVVVLIIVVASYQSMRSWGDLALLLVIGTLGWVLKRVGWPRPPILIGFVLAAPAERYLHLSMSYHDFGWIARPGVIALAACIVLLVFGSSLKKGFNSLKRTTTLTRGSS